MRIVKAFIIMLILLVVTGAIIVTIGFLDAVNEIDKWEF